MFDARGLAAVILTVHLPGLFIALQIALATGTASVFFGRGKKTSGQRVRRGLLVALLGVVPLYLLLCLLGGVRPFDLEVVQIGGRH
jgi:uncharacterized membrane protein SpoIIM required for sporulation